MFQHRGHKGFCVLFEREPHVFQRNFLNRLFYKPVEIEIYKQSGDKKYLEFIDKFIDYYVDEYGNILGYDRETYNDWDKSSCARNFPRWFWAVPLSGGKAFL